MILNLRFMIEKSPIINRKFRNILEGWVEKFRLFSFMEIFKEKLGKRSVENPSSIRTFFHTSTTFNTSLGITHDLFF